MEVGFDNPDGSRSIGRLHEIIWTTPHTRYGQDVRTCIVRPLDHHHGGPFWAVEAWRLYRVLIAAPPRCCFAEPFRHRIVGTLATDPNYLHKLDCGHFFWSEHGAEVYVEGAFCQQCFRKARDQEGSAAKC
jgi:hypothetical protein